MEPGAGERLLAQLQDPATTEAWRQTVDSTAPGFDQWIVDSVFGGTYQRAGLSLQERQVATLAALAALGGVEPQLDGHIETASRLGMDARQIAEIFVHLAPYIGLPRTIAALRRVAVASP